MIYPDQTDNYSIELFNQNFRELEEKTKQLEGEIGGAIQIDDMGGMKIFTSVSQLGLDSATADLADVVVAMPDNSILRCSSDGQLPNVSFPSSWGTLEIKRVNLNRTSLKYYVSGTGAQGRTYTGSFHSNNGFSGWQELLTEAAFKFVTKTGTTNIDGCINTGLVFPNQVIIDIKPNTSQNYRLVVNPNRHGEYWLTLLKYWGNSSEIVSDFDLNYTICYIEKS
jgi:hypothetical protein